MIDLKNLEKLSPEQREQFNEMLKQFPHLQSKAVNKLNTPTKMEMDPNNELNYGSLNSYVGDAAEEQAPAAPLHEDEIDYSSFQIPKTEPMKLNKDDIPTVRVSDGTKPQQGTFEPSPVEDEEDGIPKVTQQKASPNKKPMFSPEGKAHPVLQKMRAALGSKRITRPVEVSLGGCTYGIQALDRAAMAQATSLAVSATTNQTLYEANLETALIAFSIVTLDNVPLVDLFAVPTHYDDGKFILKKDRDVMAAQDMFSELMSSPNELVETLGIYYQQNYPMLTLLDEGKGRFMCPVASCMQFRVADMGSDNYCPKHGDKMIEEGELPNPS